MDDTELISVTNITNYICGEKIIMWRNFGKFSEFCHNLPAFMWRKIEPKKYICGEKMTIMRSGSVSQVATYRFVKPLHRQLDDSAVSRCLWPSSITARTVTKVLSASTPSPPPGLLSCAGPLLLVVLSGEATVSLLSFVRWQYFWFRASDAGSGRASG